MAYDTMYFHHKGKKLEVQFKISLGKYRPWFTQVNLLDSMHSSFPKTPFLEVEGFVCESDPKDSYQKQHCVLQFRHGVLSDVVYPIPKNYKWAPLPTGRSTKRRELAEAEDQRRRFEELKKRHPHLNGLSLFGAIIGDEIFDMMGREGFAKSLLFSADNNYTKEPRGWRRTRNKLGKPRSSVVLP